MLLSRFLRTRKLSTSFRTIIADGDRHGTVSGTTQAPRILLILQNRHGSPLKNIGRIVEHNMEKGLIRVQWTQSLGHDVAFGSSSTGDQWFPKHNIREVEDWGAGDDVCLVRFPSNVTKATFTIKSAQKGSNATNSTPFDAGLSSAESQTFALYFHPHLGNEPIIISRKTSIRELERVLKILWPSTRPPLKLSVKVIGGLVNSVDDLLGKKGVRLMVDGEEFLFNNGEVIESARKDWKGPLAAAMAVVLMAYAVKRSKKESAPIPTHDASVVKASTPSPLPSPPSPSPLPSPSEPTPLDLGTPNNLNSHSNSPPTGPRPAGASTPTPPAGGLHEGRHRPSTTSTPTAAPTEGGTSGTASPHLTKGTVVYCQWKKVGGGVYRGRVSGVNDDDYYDITYDDGDVDRHVGLPRISTQSRTGPFGILLPTSTSISISTAHPSAASQTSSSPSSSPSSSSSSSSSPPSPSSRSVPMSGGESTDRGRGNDKSSHGMDWRSLSLGAVLLLWLLGEADHQARRRGRRD